MELVLPMYNAHPYFPLKNVGKIVCTIYMAKFSISLYVIFFFPVTSKFFARTEIKLIEKL